MKISAYNDFRVIVCDRTKIRVLKLLEETYCLLGNICLRKGLLKGWNIETNTLRNKYIVFIFRLESTVERRRGKTSFAMKVRLRLD